MRILVTGATGFVGRYVVPAIARRGHTVRALIRSIPQYSGSALALPPIAPGSAGGFAGVESAHGDLLQPETLPQPLQGIDTVVHLAISVTKNREIQLAETVQSTTNLCEAMVSAGVTRIVHCSSRSVYDWSQAKKSPNESAPIDAAPQFRDDYAKAKIAQELLIQKYAANHNWTVTILRPGFIWGEGREQLAGWGHSIGPVHLVVDGRRRLPMTYIENCADCFALAVDAPGAAGQVFNIIDDDLPTARQFAEFLMRLEGRGGVFVNVPYSPGLLLAKFATGVNRSILGGRVDLPGLLVPASYRARFHPLHLSNRKAKEVLGWRPKFDFHEAWERSRRGADATLKVTGERSGNLPNEAMHGH
jgi:nucleoside-diphosphate-sugar epimerase